MMDANKIKDRIIRYLNNPNCVVIPEFGLLTSPQKEIRYDILRIRLDRRVIEGFEIKTSKADFKQDEKWELYLPYVNKFYFIVPFELVRELDNIPFEVGIITYYEYKTQWGSDACEIKIHKRGRLINPIWKTVFETSHYIRMLELALKKIDKRFK